MHNRISYSIAMLLIDLNDKTELCIFLKRSINEKLSYRNLIRLLNENKSDIKTNDFRTKNSIERYSEELLRSMIGKRVKISSGKISIYYEDIKSLADIFKKLKIKNN